MQLRHILCLAPMVAVVGLACATAPPYQEPFQATVVEPAPGEAVVVDQTIVIFDSSGSISPDDAWPADKALLESYVAGMPEGKYRAGAVNFGGKRRQEAGMGRFDREKLGQHAKDVRYFGNATPLEDVLRGAADDLDGAGGNAAIVLFSDGVPTVQGTPRSGEVELAVAAELVERHGGTVCFHAIETGDGEGTEFLEALTQLTDCGSLRSSGEIGSGSDLLAFQREVFMGAGLPAVAAAPPSPLDSDGDGVLDADDICGNTPTGAKVDGRGCWALTTLRFGSDSATVAGEGLLEVDAIAKVMQENPDLRISVDGYTDASGPEAYNQTLSERRAAAVRNRLVELGIDPNRMETQGFGESNPVASNATSEGRLENRRIEFSAIR